MKLMDKIKKNKLLYFLGVLIIGVFIVLIVRVTYAFLGANINEARENVVVDSDTTDNLQFSIGDPLVINATPTTLPKNGANLVDESVATATLLANSTNDTAEYSYYVYFTISNNTFTYTDGSTPEIILTVTGPDDNPVTNIEGLTYGTFNGVAGFDVTTQNGKFTVASNYAITASSSTDATKHDWTFTLTYLNLSFDQSGNYGNSMTTEISMTKEEKVPTLADLCSDKSAAECIMSQLYTTDGENGLYYHDGVGTYTNATEEAGDNSYRYSGSNPNNYVCFGVTGADCQNAENQYRIIGVFNNQVKLIKSTSYGDYAWEADDLNTWDESTKPDIYTTLNTTYYNTLGREWQNLIAESTWQVGGMGYSTTNTAKQYYDVEVGTGQSGYEETMKIGLMYVSDYGYGANPEKWTTALYEENYGTDNWLYLGNDEWLISRNADITGAAFRVNSGVFFGGVSVVGDRVVRAYVVRPSFYLESNVSLQGGSGTSSDPYRLAV